MQEIPTEYKRYLESGQPLWLYHGNLQIRGLSVEPRWNNLHRYWLGERAFHKAYNSLLETDIPFAQDCFGDQFILRKEIVFKLQCESDDYEKTGLSFSQWLNWIGENPDERLNVDTSVAISPGNLLMAFPPFCFKEASSASIKEISMDEVHAFHAEIASKIRNLGDGEKIELRFGNDPSEQNGQ